MRECDPEALLRPLIKLVIGERDTHDRTEVDIRREAEKAGLQVVSVTPLPPGMAAVTCTPAPRAFVAANQLSARAGRGTGEGSCNQGKAVA